jgi:NTE family protein
MGTPRPSESPADQPGPQTGQAQPGSPPVTMDPSAAVDHPLRILQASAAFSDVAATDLEGCRAEVRSIPAGTTLFEQGDRADVAYVVETGIVGLYTREDQPGPGRPFRKVVPGELMGEYGLLCDQPRSATAVALTDCSLLALERSLLNRLLDRRPAIQATLLRQIAAAASRGRSSDRHPLRSVALLDLQPGSAATAETITRLRRELTGDPGGTAAPIALAEPIDEDDCHRHLIALASGEGTGLLLLRDSAMLSARNRQLIDRLVTLEQAGHGQAQRADPDLAVLLWPQHTSRPLPGPASRLRSQGIPCLHIRADSPRETGRLARMVLRRPTMLVLGGGGARGFAHIGALAALEELGEPVIDGVLGVSVGALVGSLVAFDLRADQILEELERVIIRSRPYTLKLPTDALFSLENSRRALEAFFGSASLEDAWLPYQAFSTNLTSKQLHSWDQGSIPEAVIASMSVPGIFAPCVDAAGDLHVDGGILSNLPIRQARELTDGRVIAVSLDSPAEPGAAPGRPSLASTIINAMMCSSHAEGLADAALADVVLRPAISAYSFLEWKQFRRIHAAGYAEALAVFGAERSARAAQGSRAST